VILCRKGATLGLGWRRLPVPQRHFAVARAAPRVRGAPRRDAIPNPPLQNYQGTMTKPPSLARPCLALAALATGLVSPSAIAGGGPPEPMPVYLLNGSFDEPEPGTTPGEAVDSPAVCSGAIGRPTASWAWSTWQNEPLRQMTSWLTTSPDGLYTANLVYGGTASGLVTVLSQSPTHWIQVYDDTLTNMNSAGVWVWVVAGGVTVQFGNGGAAGGQLHHSQTQGQWEWVGGCGRSDGLNNEITIYADGPSIFYVDDASIEYDPVCAGGKS
jgi:hypothetical protein